MGGLQCRSCSCTSDETCTCPRAYRWCGWGSRTTRATTRGCRARRWWTWATQRCATTWTRGGSRGGGGVGVEGRGGGMWVCGGGGCGPGRGPSPTSPAAAAAAQRREQRWFPSLQTWPSFSTAISLLSNLLLLEHHHHHYHHHTSHACTLAHSRPSPQPPRALQAGGPDEVPAAVHARGDAAPC